MWLLQQRAGGMRGATGADTLPMCPLPQVRMLCLPIDILAHHVTQGNTVRYQKQRSNCMQCLGVHACGDRL